MIQVQIVILIKFERHCVGCGRSVGQIIRDRIICSCLELRKGWSRSSQRFNLTCHVFIRVRVVCGLSIHRSVTSSSNIWNSDSRDDGDDRDDNEKFDQAEGRVEL